MFHHIPIPETWKASASSKLLGTFGELIVSPENNSKFFRSVLREDSIKGDFFGHDHNNDYSTVY